MNADQKSLTTMANVVSVYMAKNKTIWQGTPAVLATVGDVDAVIAAITEADKKQQTSTGGEEVDKTTIRHNYEEKILLIADQLASLASATGNALLAGKVHFTISTLDKMSAIDLLGCGQSVADLATANLTGLADYKIAAADVTDLLAKRTAFDGAKTEPRNAVVDRKKITDTLPGLCATLRTILRQRLDKQMTAFKASNPEFYAGYLAARVVVDRATRHKKPGTNPPTR